MEKVRGFKYVWPANRLSDDDMKKSYHLKQQTKKPITVMVAEAIKKYLKTEK